MNEKRILIRYRRCATAGVRVVVLATCLAGMCLPGSAQEMSRENPAQRIVAQLLDRQQKPFSFLPDGSAPRGNTDGQQASELPLAKVAAQMASPQVRIEVANTKPFAGERVDLQFRVGTPDAAVDNLFGVGFELHYSDDRYLDFSATTDAIAGAFLRPNVYTFTRHEPDQRVFYLAVSRKRGADCANGDGVVLTLPFSITADAVPGWQVCFAIRNVIANEPDGTPLALEAGPELCLQVGEPAVEVVPNPITPNGDGYNDDVEFKRDGGIPAAWQIRIMDRNGILLRTLTGGANRWDGRDADGRLQLPGVYLYVIRDGERVVKRGVLGIIR